MECSFKSISGENVVVSNSNLQFIYKDSAYLKMSFGDFFGRSCGSVVEHCVSSAKGCGFNSQGTHILIKNV